EGHAVLGALVGGHGARALADDPDTGPAAPFDHVGGLSARRGRGDGEGRHAVDAALPGLRPMQGRSVHHLMDVAFQHQVRAMVNWSMASGKSLKKTVRAASSAFSQIDSNTGEAAIRAEATRAPVWVPVNGPRPHGRARPTSTSTRGYSQTMLKIAGATRAVNA